MNQQPSRVLLEEQNMFFSPKQPCQKFSLDLLVPFIIPKMDTLINSQLYAVFCLLPGISNDSNEYDSNCSHLNWLYRSAGACAFGKKLFSLTFLLRFLAAPQQFVWLVCKMYQVWQQMFLLLVSVLQMLKYVNLAGKNIPLSSRVSKCEGWTTVGATTLRRWSCTDVLPEFKRGDDECS